MGRRRAVAALVLACSMGALHVGTASPDVQPTFRVLVFTKTAAYRHDSIPDAIAAVEELAAQGGFAVDATEDASAFSDSNLAKYAVVVFLLTTGDVLDPGQQAAFMHYIEGGGGFVGVHSASDTEHDWPWYGGLVGAYFATHPAIQTAVVDVADRDTPSTIHLPAHWTRTDEWYNFQTNPRGSVTVLATLDETSYAPGDGAMGSDHPIAWQHEYDGGRSWYTAGGHTAESYSEPLFRSHLLGGILWAAGFELPRIASLRAHVDKHRLTVTFRHPDCQRCDAQITVRVRGRAVVADAGADGGQTRVTTPELPPGEWRYTVVLSDRRMATHVTVSRSIRVV